MKVRIWGSHNGQRVVKVDLYEILERCLGVWGSTSHVVKYRFDWDSARGVVCVSVYERKSVCTQSAGIILCLTRLHRKIGLKCCETEIHHATACNAILIAPSNDRLPPMNPLACTKTHPAIPATPSSASSRNPLQAWGKALLLSKLPWLTPTA